MLKPRTSEGMTPCNSQGVRLVEIALLSSKLGY